MEAHDVWCMMMGFGEGRMVSCMMMRFLGWRGLGECSG